jgi:hypothetical protein
MAILRKHAHERVSFGVRRGTTLLPVEFNVVNRDDLTQTWINKQPGTAVVYSGSTTGDMVGWKIDVPSGWEGATFTWIATGSNGESITGPTGVGVDHWQISDGGNDPSDKTALAWKPDQYVIQCTIVFPSGQTALAKIDQTVGWRTEDYLVIGQIVNTTTFASSGPSTLLQSLAFRDAIATDNVPNIALAALIPTALPNSAFGFAEFATWGLVPHSITPQGPLSYFGAITEGDRYWMLENALNASVDTPTAPSTIEAVDLPDTLSNGMYRIYHHYQTRFSLTSAGKVDATTLHDIHNDAITGQTKFNIPANAFSPVWDNPDLPLFTLAAQTNPIDSVPGQGAVQTSYDGTKHSSYASGRVGSDGQNVNYRVFGQDVPWIFSEIICQVASDHTVTSNIKMSVNKTWQDSSGVSGKTNFNNLNIYKAVFLPATGVLNYVSQHDSPLLMQGQLQNFILSVRYGTWPTPPTIPSVP